MPRHNRIDKRVLRKQVVMDARPRSTLSFYRYVSIPNPQGFRDRAYGLWQALGVLGRVYVATEGINAQVSVPTENLSSFRGTVDSLPGLEDMDYRVALEDDFSFWVLTIKVKEKIVADGLPVGALDLSQKGEALEAEDFHRVMELPGAVVMDMRNSYESEIGHFAGAMTPKAKTFREVLPLALEMLADKKEDPVLLYCTGGIRCEKASALLRREGFRDVYQLRGGIIRYAQRVRDLGLGSRFKGTNFVFDARMAERVTEDVISLCYSCGVACDRHLNCAHKACHRLVLQCDACERALNACCSQFCQRSLNSLADLHSKG